MPQATFTPKYLNQPKGNARSASIKDSDGGYWGCHPGDLGKFIAGQPVTVEYSTSENNGRTYYNIKSIVGQQTSANPQTRLVQDVRPIAHAPNDGSTMPRQPNPQADPRKSEDIFVCGVVNHAIAHQSFPLIVDELVRLVRSAREAWRAGEPGPGYSGPPDAPLPGSPDDNWEPDPRG